MTPIFHHNVPNNLIQISDGVSDYLDTISNYTTDYGSAPPSLPVGGFERIYQPNTRHVINTSTGPVGGDVPWAAGDSIIGDIGAIISAKGARLAAAAAAEEAAAEQAEAEAIANAAIPPRIVASALNIVVSNFDIAAVQGNFNIGGVLYLGVGQYMLLFAAPQSDDSYFAVIAGGAPCMGIIEKSTDYLIIDARAEVGGANVDPAQFGIQIFRV